MSSARGLANHSLYMARLLLDAWHQQTQTSRTEPRILSAAFAPAVRLHLLDAYGWFLLALLRVPALPDHAPQRIADLPAIKSGIAEPPEISEFRELEQTGWLHELLAPPVRGVGQISHRQRLASTADRPQIHQYGEWHGELTSLFTRMSVSLDEC